MESGGLVTAEHLYAKARIFSEGVRIDGKDELPFAEGLANLAKRHKRNKLCPTPPIKPPTGDLAPEQIEMIWKATASAMEDSAGESKPMSGMRITFDGSGLSTYVHANKYSRLLLTQEGDRVTVTDGEEVVVTGYVTQSLDLSGKTVSNGLPITTFLPGMSNELINIVFYLSCDNYNTGRGCKYCNLFANPLSEAANEAPLSLQESWAKYQAEAVKIVLDHGWNGHLVLSGGSLPPSVQPHYLTYLRICLDALRQAVGEETFRELDIVYNHYPPEHFEDMEKWKALGIKRTNIDLEVMDPAYFPVICPGKAMHRPLEFWKRAQEASVEVFGPFAHTTGNIVLGIEPMSSVIDGTEERLSKGVMPRPVIFCSAPNSEFWGFRPPTADWIMEATDRMATQYMKYVPFEVNDIETGPTMLVFDMIKHKMQMGAV